MNEACFLCNAGLAISSDELATGIAAARTPSKLIDYNEFVSNLVVAAGYVITCLDILIVLYLRFSDGGEYVFVYRDFEQKRNTVGAAAYLRRKVQ